MTRPPPAAASGLRLRLAILVAGMLVSGCSNSLWTKWQDMQCVADCDAPNPAKRRLFEQPVYQVLAMFAGESLCLIAFAILNSRFNPVVRKRRKQQQGYEPVAAHEEAAGEVTPPPQQRPGRPVEDGTGEDGDPLKAKQMSRKEAAMFLLPALCDNAATTFMSIGLFFVPVSVYQMLRGALVL